MRSQLLTRVSRTVVDGAAARFLALRALHSSGTVAQALPTSAGSGLPVPATAGWLSPGAMPRHFGAQPMPAVVVEDLPHPAGWLQGPTDAVRMPQRAEAELLVTCIGRHQTGVVADLTDVIQAHGGHVKETKTMRVGLQISRLTGMIGGGKRQVCLGAVPPLGDHWVSDLNATGCVACGQFCLVATVWVGDRAKADLLRKALNDITDHKAVSTMWIPDSWHERGVEYNEHTLTVTGVQQKGVVNKFASAVAKHGVQIADSQLSTQERNGETLLTWRSTLEVPKDLDVARVRAEVTAVGGALELNTTLQ